MKNAILLTVFLLILSPVVFAQSTKKEEKEKQKEQQYQQALALVEAGKFEFIGRKANPQRGRQIDLTTRPNFLRIDGKNAAADMPYFGHAFSGGYSNTDGGIKFEGPMESYEVQKNDKKRRLTIKFKVKGEGDSFSCTLSISSLESASLSVISNTRQAISYVGTLKKPSSEE